MDDEANLGGDRRSEAAMFDEVGVDNGVNSGNSQTSVLFAFKAGGHTGKNIHCCSYGLVLDMSVEYGSSPVYSLPYISLSDHLVLYSCR